VTYRLRLSVKRESTRARRVPIARWGFDSQPYDLESPAKCFVLELDTLKILPDVLLILIDNLKILPDVLFVLQDSFKILWDHIKSSQDLLLSLQDNIKTTRDHIKSKQDILPGLTDNIKSSRDTIKIRARQFLYLPGNAEIQPDYLLFRVDNLNCSDASKCSTPDRFVSLQNCFRWRMILPRQFGILL
jgi:hypothetical protein